MPERRGCYKTGREDQYVTGREQNQGGTTESRSCFHNVIIYYINEYAVQQLFSR